MKTILLGAAGALLFAMQAQAADIRSEIINAHEHADYAAQATNINDVHMHLHHALNCLVGPNGDGFDAKQLNPCANSGAGIIPDTATAAKKKPFEDAAAKAKAGIAENDFGKAKKIATDLSTVLAAQE